MNALGWTLIHFIWQGLIVGVLFALALAAGRKHRGATASSYRYGVAFIALILAVVTPLLTFAWQLLDVQSVVIDSSTILTLYSIGESTTIWHNVQDNWLGYLLIAWLVGVSWGSARLLVSWLSLHMIRHTGIVPTPQWLENEFRRLRLECNVQRPISIMVSSLVRVPLTAGWLKPVILLPTTALTGLHPEQIRLILRHELAHIQRYDYLVNWLQNLVAIVLFYHPVVHWIVHILNDERELCCDHEAIRNRCRPIDYAKILVKLQEAITQPVPQPALAASGRSGLYRRVERLLNSEVEQISKGNNGSRSYAWVFTVMLSALVTTVGVIGSPSGHASYNEQPTVVNTIVHPLSELPKMVERAHAQREELLREHQLTNFKQFQWQSALGPIDKQSSEVVDDDIEIEETVERLPQVILSELHQRMMQTVKQQLPAENEQSDRSRQISSPMSLVEKPSIFPVRVVRQNRLDLVELDTELLPLIDNEANIDTKSRFLTGRAPEPYHKVKPKYPKRMAGIIEQETVDIIYSIGPDGRPMDMVVISLDVHKDFTDAAVEALAQWRFEPVDVETQKLRIKQPFNFIRLQQASSSRHCSTGSRICRRVGGNFSETINVN